MLVLVIMKGMIDEFVVIVSRIRPCVERKMRRNCFFIYIMSYNTDTDG